MENGEVPIRSSCPMRRHSADSTHQSLTFIRVQSHESDVIYNGGTSCEKKKSGGILKTRSEKKRTKSVTYLPYFSKTRTNRKDSLPVKKKVQFVPYVPKICREIPGLSRRCAMMSHLYSLRVKLNGHNFIKKQIKKYKSTVVRVNFYGPRIMLCDYEAIQSLFDCAIIKKEYQFGSFIYQQNILKGHIPFEFTNCVSYGFMVHRLKTMDGENSNIRYLSKIIANEFSILSTRSLITKDFEDIVGHCMNDIVTQALLGVRLQYSHVKNWSEYLLIPVPTKGGEDEDCEQEKSREILIKQIELSPVAASLAKYVEKHHFDIREVALELLPMLVFNGWKSLTAVLLSIMIYLVTSVNKNQMIQLKYEAARVLKYEEDIDVLFHLENFILEVIRLHPPAKSIFGVAKEPFVMDSQCGLFKIQKGELLCGDIYWTQRNPEIFENPNRFHFDRFSKNPELVNFICAFGGNYHDAPKTLNKCIGQQFSLNILKLCVCHLMFCDIQPSCAPKWTGRKVWRLSASDKPFTVRTFKYNGVS